MDVKQFFRNNIALFLFFISSLIVLLLAINANINLGKTVGLMEQSTQEFLMAAANALSDYVPVEELDRYHTVEDILDAGGLEDYHSRGNVFTGEEEFIPDYQDLKERLTVFAKRYQVLYAYFWRPYHNDEIQYIADNDYTEDICTPATRYPLEDLSKEIIDNRAPTATHFDEYTIDWVGVITGLAPIFDKDGNLYCVAGVDISDERLLSQRDATRQRYILQVIAIAATILASGAMFLLYRQKIKQLNVFNTNLQEMVEEETKKVLALNETFGRYLSDEIVKDLLDTPDGLSLGGKKQNITIMFTDIRGFTSMSEMMGVEDAVTMLNHYFSVMVDVIHKYRGTVIEFLGDGILAIFGAPVAYENHIDSAVACAVEMQISMDEVNEWNLKNRYPILEMGVGINSGETIVGNIGSPKSMKYNVIGNNVNLASRIENFSTGGQIWISEGSYSGMKSVLKVGQSLEVSPKGVKTPITVYQIEGIGAPYFLELKNNDIPLTQLPAPVPITCYRIDDKRVEVKQLRYYMLSVSAAKGIVIAGKGEESLGVFENIKVVNSTGDEVLAKIIRKSNEGVIIVRFTTDAGDFIKHL
ncbi:MAG: adenylate/guanylate cyclase domain-containing protein [Treponema sp.]|jgi:class 3 adenylate cyclase|nr:adenylate/guanylate cyclase domain-containing protein [Treponema sp.]